MNWIQTADDWTEEHLRQVARRGKWIFAWWIGIFGWGGLMVCAINWWFYRLTNYSHLTVLLLSLLVLPVGAVVGLGMYKNARKTAEEQRQFWLQQRERGKASFVWRRGVLGYGGSMFIVLTILVLLTDGFRPDMMMFIIPLNLIIWAVGGAVAAIMVWEGLEKRYP